MNIKVNQTIIAIVSALLIFACNPSVGQEETAKSDLPASSSSDSGKISPEMATVTPDTINTQTQSFMESAHYEIGLQINMAKLTMQNSTSEAIRNLGKTIVDQGTELNNKLQSIAESKEVKFPTQKNSSMESAMEVYKSKKGKDFDNLYLDWVITSTQNHLEKYEKESKQIEDKDIQQFAVNALPIFKQHHDAAQALKDK